MVAQTPAPPTGSTRTPGEQQVQQPKQAAAPKAPFTIQSTKRAERFLNIMVYGDYGVGKTFLAASSDDVPEMRDVLIIDAEAGDLSVSDRNVDSIRVTNFTTLGHVHTYLRRHIQEWEAGNIENVKKLEEFYRGHAPEGEPKRYKTVVLDSLSEVQKFAMWHTLGTDLSRVKMETEPDTPQIQDWGKNLEYMQRLVRALRDLDMNFICVCPEKVDQDERKQNRIRPLLTGAVERLIPGFFDVVGYMQAGPGGEDGKITRRLHLQPGRTFLAKNRFGNVTVPYIDNPSMAEIYRLCMRGGK